MGSGLSPVLLLESLISFSFGMRFVIYKNPPLEDVQLATNPDEIRLLFQFLLFGSPAQQAQLSRPVPQLVAEERLWGVLCDVAVGVRDAKGYLAGG